MDTPSTSPTPLKFPKRCAIYTRKSSEHGLQQDFNSLQAQHAICSAYIESQHHKAWQEVEKTYVDAAESGGTLDRPALKDLLRDIERGRIDVVIVYKLDRLSRSLLDFVRLMDVFKRYEVSFACITQNFDTDDSLGRLVMNILLTFAQFEREITGDRIRDKRRAMTLRGLWSGGRPPLGYDLINKRLVVNPEEAEIVRFIYDRYSESRNLTAVERACTERSYQSKTWLPSTGLLKHGVPIRANQVRKIVMNPIYAGFLQSAGKRHRGIHESIVSPEQWDRVEGLRHAELERRTRLATREVLDGLMYDCFGRSMSVNRLLKGETLHVHYRSNQSVWGKQSGIKRMRLRADTAEQLILSALRKLFCDREQLRGLLLDLGRHGADLELACRRAAVASRRLEALSRDQLRSTLHGIIVRVEVARERIKLVTRPLEHENLISWDFIGLFRRRTEDTDHARTYLIDIPCAGAIRLQRHVRLPIDTRKAQTHRINKRLRDLISEAREIWLIIQCNRDVPPANVAKTRNMSLSRLMRLVRLNYLAPDIVTSILDGAQPRGVTRRALLDADLPLDWAIQRQLFGFPEQRPMRTAEEAY